MLYLTTGVCDRAGTVDISESLSTEQLQRPLKKGDKIRILDLLDVPVFFEVKTDDFQAHRRIGNVVYTAQEPILQYVSYQSLKRRIESACESPNLAFCSLRIQHTLIGRNTITGEPEADFKSKSMNEVHRIFAAALQIWEESSIWAEIKDILSSAATADKITKIIGFRCGRMPASDDVPHTSYNAAFQHALLLTLQQFVEESWGHEVICAVPDPAYTDWDIYPFFALLELMS
ncbi:uncharacterized protein APUU_10166S [Aspergillus puulaauensis]|uniref:SRR1-like domain-containing protein n=1 Tax=Aspergillus puulaauensis TaxID=1220207 RepID=A0A7R7X9Q7_9EURO|nr:uncharacterized protein APUU_10166S [Aspergillus puulaauensis]BCS17338.1 hypothetical protein APUU_10166S [Aspergillus puulaauensis]